MNRSIRRGSTFANVAAGTALVLTIAGGGAAVAAGLGVGSVTSKHIKDGTVRGIDVAESSFDTVPHAEYARGADEALTAGTAEAAHRLLGMSRAAVRADGSLVDQSGGDIVSAEQTTTPGRYIVTFSSPNLGCAVLPAVSHNGTDVVAGSASAWRLGPLQQTLGLKLVVETHAPDGNGVPDPLPFTVLVVC